MYSRENNGYKWWTVRLCADGRFIDTAHIWARGSLVKEARARELSLDDMRKVGFFGNGGIIGRDRGDGALDWSRPVKLGSIDVSYL
jgi:hypothetical protein